MDEKSTVTEWQYQWKDEDGELLWIPEDGRAEAWWKANKTKGGQGRIRSRQIIVERSAWIEENTRGE